MPVITLPDGSQRAFDNPVSVYNVAADIGAGLAKATLAGKVDEQMVDASYVIENDATLSIITNKSEEALELLRHDAAHVMAQAVQELYPGTQVTIGPAIENGFYYDFARETKLTHDEWRQGIAFLEGCAAIETEDRHEFVLASDVLGLSSLVDMLHSSPAATSSR